MRADPAPGGAGSDGRRADATADRIAATAGVLRQHGASDEPRDRPADPFVAAFLGEPPMNALPAEAGGVRLPPGPRPPVSGEPPRPGTPVVQGLRPHRVRLGEGPWRATVVADRRPGDRAHVALDLAGLPVVALAGAAAEEVRRFVAGEPPPNPC